MALFSIALTFAHAEVITMRLGGTITSAPEAMPELLGQSWNLTLVYDTTTPDSDPGANWGLYLGPTSEFTFSSGDFSYQLDKSTLAPGYGSRIDIGNHNGGSEKTLAVHAFPSVPLPLWHGHSPDGTTFFIGGSGSPFADGTDTLPTDPSVSFANLTSGNLSMFFNDTTTLTATVTNAQFTVVPEPGATALAAVGVLIFIAARRRASLLNRSKQ